MKKRSNWLIAAALMLTCISCTPVYATEAPITEGIDLPTEVIETPTENVEMPVEQPVTAEIPTVPEAPEVILAEEVPNPYTPAMPALLTDHLDPEIYASLEDPNVKIVLIDISDQRVWAFENGSSVLESPMVSGTAGTKAETSRGIFKVEFKKLGKYLYGSINKDTGKPSYKTWVDYWMLFDSSRSIGLHDAKWRTTDEYVIETYLTDGSHGCVNLPCDFAPLLYEFVEIGTPVIVQDQSQTSKLS